MFEVGVGRTFHALHQLEGDHDAAGEHSHDYRAEVVARGQTLAENGMLVDLDALGAAASACLAELDESDLDTLPAFAGAETTVERVAGHICDHVRELLAPPASVVALRVTVYESADAWAAVERLIDQP